MQLTASENRDKVGQGFPQVGFCGFLKQPFKPEPDCAKFCTLVSPAFGPAMRHSPPRVSRRKDGLGITLAISGSRPWRPTPMDMFTCSIRNMAAVPGLRDLYASLIALIGQRRQRGHLAGRPGRLLPFPDRAVRSADRGRSVDRQTVYASWLQNDKRDIVIARSLDFGADLVIFVCRARARRGRQAGSGGPRGRRLRRIQPRRRVSCRGIARCRADLQRSGESQCRAGPGSSLAGRSDR